MKLDFKFDEYYEILDDYENLLSKFEPRFTSIPGDENSIGLSPIRVVIPSLHASFMEGNWYWRNEEIEDENDKDAWEYQDGAGVVYEENETNINNYLYFISGDIETAVAFYCRENEIKISSTAELDCYIDFEEFVSDKNMQRLMNNEWDKELDALTSWPPKPVPTENS